MKYYTVDVAFDPKVIGVRNGVYQIEVGEDNFINHQTYERVTNFFLHSNYWQHENVVPDFPIELKQVRLLKKASLTDIMGYSGRLIGCPFAVSERIINIFKHFRIQDNYLYPIELYTYEGERITTPYYLFYCPFLGFDVVDYENSVLYSGDDLLGDKQYYSIYSLEEYLALLDSNPFIRFDKLTIAPQKELDLYQLRTGGLFISEPLKEAIELMKLTGLVYGEVPELVVKTV